jgi:Xaa-Pro aminopeptidase
MALPEASGSTRERLSLPFAEEEYGRRVAAVREVMDARGIDLLYVTNPANIYYLTNVEAIWFAGRTPTGVALGRSGPVLYFDSWNHGGIVRAQGVVDEFIPFERYTGVPELVANLRARGLTSGTVAVEAWVPNPAPPIKEQIVAALTDAGARVIDGSFIVDDVRFVKSPAEIAYIEEAAALADTAMNAVQEMIAPGVSESEISAEIYRVCMTAGGGEPGIRNMVHSGPRSAHHHGAASQRKLQVGDLVVVDFCSVIHRYHADLARTFAIGSVPEAEEMMATIAGSIDEVVDRVREPGKPLQVVQDIAEEYLRNHDLLRHGHFIGGYALGVAFPPDWVGHVYLGSNTMSERTFDVGAVMNYENLMEVKDEGWGLGYIDTLIMRPNGLEVLSDYNRNLIVID